MPRKLIETSPKEIYLHISDNLDSFDEPFPDHYKTEVGWATKAHLPCCVKYVRSDIAESERYQSNTWLPLETLPKSDYSSGEVVLLVNGKARLASIIGGIWTETKSDLKGIIKIEDIQGWMKLPMREVHP